MSDYDDDPTCDCGSQEDLKNQYDGFAKSEGRKETIEVPVGEWIDVPKGMLAAPGTYVDDEGVMRVASDDSCAVWHRQGCLEKGIRPDQIIYDISGAPWCPECYMSFQAKRDAETEKERLQGMFSARESELSARESEKAWGEARRYKEEEEKK